LIGHKVCGQPSNPERPKELWDPYAGLFQLHDPQAFGEATTIWTATLLPLAKCKAGVCPKSVECALQEVTEVTQVRSVPNPHGRLGGPAHRAVVDELAGAFEDMGYSVTKEKYVRTPGGAKPYRYVDLFGSKPGEPDFYIQVGRQLKSGDPVSRERQAILDLKLGGCHDVLFAPCK
jgi:hypothetical protein